MNYITFRGKKKFKVRLGDWDLSKNDEPFEAKEYRVAQVVVHPRFNPQTFQNDIAVLKLADPVDLGSYPNIRSACLSTPRDAYIYKGARYGINRKKLCSIIRIQVCKITFYPWF